MCMIILEIVVLLLFDWLAGFLCYSPLLNGPTAVQQSIQCVVPQTGLESTINCVEPNDHRVSCWHIWSIVWVPSEISFPNSPIPTLLHQQCWCLSWAWHLWQWGFESFHPSTNNKWPEHNPMVKQGNVIFLNFLLPLSLQRMSRI